MKEVYPEFAGKVDFYALGENPVESIERLEEYRQEQGYPWPIAKIEPQVLKDLRVIRRSTKIALDHQGVITYRAGYGDGSSAEWRQVFNDLVNRAGQ